MQENKLSLAATDVLLTQVLRNEQHLNKDQNFDHQMSLSKSKCWHSNNSLHFLMQCSIEKNIA